MCVCVCFMAGLLGCLITCFYSLVPAVGLTGVCQVTVLGWDSNHAPRTDKLI